MAYGVNANALLLSIGIPPVIATASVHISEVFTTLASGISHFKFKNVDFKIIKRLIIPGVLGGIVGAYLLSQFSVEVLKPIITIYLLLMGIRILVKAFRNIPWFKFRTGHYLVLGLLGGFFDAVGGGGWGPIVTSTLLGQDDEARKVIGSVNISEFFVTLSEAITFFAILGTAPWTIIDGLITGGIIAAPLAAFMRSKIANRTRFIVVGCVIILLQIRALLGWIGIQTI